MSAAAATMPEQPTCPRCRYWAWSPEQLGQPSARTPDGRTHHPSCPELAGALREKLAGYESELAPAMRRLSRLELAGEAARRREIIVSAWRARRAPRSPLEAQHELRRARALERGLADFGIRLWWRKPRTVGQAASTPSSPQPPPPSPPAPQGTSAPAAIVLAQGTNEPVTLAPWQTVSIAAPGNIVATGTDASGVIEITSDPQTEWATVLATAGGYTVARFTYIAPTGAKAAALLPVFVVDTPTTSSSSSSSSTSTQGRRVGAAAPPATSSTPDPESVAALQSYRAMWDPWVLAVARAAQTAQAEATKIAQGGDSSLISPDLWTNHPENKQEIAGLVAEQMDSTVKAIVGDQTPGAPPGGCWNMYANVQPSFILTNAAQILQSEQACVVTVGGYWTDVLRVMPSATPPPTPTLDVQSQAIGQLQTLSIVKQGMLQLLGYGVDGAIDFLGDVAGAAKSAVQSAASALPFIGLGLLGVGAIMLARK